MLKSVLLILINRFIFHYNFKQKKIIRQVLSSNKYIFVNKNNTKIMTYTIFFLLLQTFFDSFTKNM